MFVLNPIQVSSLISNVIPLILPPKSDDVSCFHMLQTRKNRVINRETKRYNYNLSQYFHQAHLVPLSINRTASSNSFLSFCSGTSILFRICVPGRVDGTYFPLRGSRTPYRNPQLSPFDRWPTEIWPNMWICWPRLGVYTSGQRFVSLSP